MYKEKGNNVKSFINRIGSLIILFVLGFFIKYNYVFADCIFGDKNDSKTLAFWLYWAIDTMKWILPVIVVIYATFDLVMAVISSSEDKMKKAQANVFKRILWGFVLFLVPSLVELILSHVSIGVGCK